MSRWAHDPERAADALIERGLGEIALGHNVLLVNQGGALPTMLAARGMAHAVWNRRLIGGFAATPWPPAGPFESALVRLPKARDEQAMTLHAALSVLAAGGRVILYGGNDEGIRSAGGVLEELAGTIETLAIRGHGRVLAGRRPEQASVRGTLAAWRRVGSIEIAGIARDWVDYPGIFAAGRLDEGTALLLAALPPLAARARVLDYGCGSGVIGTAVRAVEPSVALDMLDSDAVALEAVRENAPGAKLVLGTRVGDAGRQVYDAILSNPPLHQGIAEDHSLLQRLVADAPAYLARGGVLHMVVQRRIPLERMLTTHFADTKIAAENGRYRVWTARRG